MAESGGHMPDCVAHYKFGQDVLERLDTHLKSCIFAYRQEYNVGLQGPDIFFFYKPYRKTDIADYGIVCHEQPAIRMFAPILAKVRENAALSYLMGLICHYTLDACCHPYVYGHSRELSDHLRMEAAYDRHILAQYGFAKARCLLVYGYKPDFNAMAELWPGISAETIRKCVKAARFYSWLLDHKGLLQLCETVAGKRGVFSPMSLPDVISQEQQEHASRLDTLYFKALDVCPERIRRACKAMGTGLQQPEGFEMNYKGGEAYDEQAGEKLDTL